MEGVLIVTCSKLKRFYDSMISFYKLTRQQLVSQIAKKISIYIEDN